MGLIVLGLGSLERFVVYRTEEFFESRWVVGLHPGLNFFGNPFGNRKALSRGFSFNLFEGLSIYVEGYLRHSIPPLRSIQLPTRGLGFRAGDGGEGLQQGHESRRLGEAASGCEPGGVPWYSSGMRIGIVLGKFPVLSEQFLLTQISGLIDEGHEVRILATDRPDGSTAIQPLVEEYDLFSRTRYLRIPTAMAARFFSLAFVIAPWALFRLNTLRMILKTKRQSPQIGLFRLLYSAYRFGKERFDVLHCHFGHNGYVAGLLKQLGVAPALVVSFHGHDVNSYIRQYGKEVYRPLIHITDATTANTRFTKEKASYCGFPPDRIGIVPEGLRVKDYPVRDHRPEKGRFVVLTVGRLAEKKGHKYVVGALGQVKDKIAGLEYRMLGDGPMRAEVEAQVDSLGLREICTFLGAQPANVVRDELRRCDVFVLASVTSRTGDMEGQAVVLQEAQAMGVPVISTLHNGIPDGVLDKQSGFLVPEGDSEALAEKLLWFAENLDAIPKMGKAGSKFVRDKYDVKPVTDAVLRVYHLALEET